MQQQQQQQALAEQQRRQQQVYGQAAMYNTSGLVQQQQQQQQQFMYAATGYGQPLQAGYALATYPYGYQQQQQQQPGPGAQYAYAAYAQQAQAGYPWAAATAQADTQFAQIYAANAPVAAAQAPTAEVQASTSSLIPPHKEVPGSWPMDGVVDQRFKAPPQGIPAVGIAPPLPTGCLGRLSPQPFSPRCSRQAQWSPSRDRPVSPSTGAISTRTT